MSSTDIVLELLAVPHDKQHIRGIVAIPARTMLVIGFNLYMTSLVLLMMQRYVEDAALSGNPVLISGNNVQYQRFAKLYLPSLDIITDIKHNFTHP